MGKGAAIANKGEGNAPDKKQHRKKNAKLLKKRYHKRNKKSFKANRRDLRQIKRDKDELRKLGYINKAFADKIPCDKIMEISNTLQKLLKHAKDEATEDDNTCKQDLIEMFSSLDEGAQIDLAALQDEYMQAKLLRLFSLMRLQHGKAIRKDDRLKFQKRQTGELHDFEFAKMIKYMLKRAAEKIVEKDEEKADKVANGDVGDGLSDNTSSDDDEEDDKDMADSSDANDEIDEEICDDHPILRLKDKAHA